MTQENQVRPTKPVDIMGEHGKPRLLALVFCDYLSWTKDDKANLLGIFDRIYVHPDRKVTPTFALFIRSAETTEEGISIRVFAPDGGEIIALDWKGVDSSIPFTPNLPAHVQSSTQIQFVAHQEGVYWFAAFYKGEPLGGAGLVVEYRQTEDKQSGTDTYI